MLKGRFQHCPVTEHPDRNPSLRVQRSGDHVAYACLSRGCSTTDIAAACGIAMDGYTPKLGVSGVRAEEPTAAFETIVNQHVVRTKTRYEVFHPVTRERVGKDFHTEWHVDDSERSEYWPALYPHDTAVQECTELAEDGHTTITLVVGEGEKQADALAEQYDEHGVPAVATSLPDGIADTHAAVTAITRLLDALDDLEGVTIDLILAADRDAPGIRGVAAIYTTLRRDHVRVRLGAAPDGFHDPGDAAEAGQFPAVVPVESLAGLLAETGLPPDVGTEAADALTARSRCALDLGIDESSLLQHLEPVARWALAEQGFRLARMARTDRLVLQPRAKVGVWRDIEKLETTLDRAFYRTLGYQLSTAQRSTAASQLRGWLGDHLPVDPPTRFHTRIDGSIEVDLGPGTQGKQTVVIDPDRDCLTLSATPTVQFYRTASAVDLPGIDRDAACDDIHRLWEVVNVAEDQRHWVLAWLILVICGARENSPLVFRGEAGSGKSTAQRILADLVDPHDRDPRRALMAWPRSEDELALLSESHTAVGFDNLGTIPPDMREMIQMLVTGGTLVKRKLYSDSSLVQHQLRLHMTLSSIALRGLKADAVDRVTMVDITRPAQRPGSGAVTARWQEIAPTVFTALLRLVQTVQRARREHAAELRALDTHRITEFGQTVWLLDQIFGGDGHTALMDNRAAAQAEAPLDPWLRALCTMIIHEPETVIDKRLTATELQGLEPEQSVHPLTQTEQSALEQAVPRSPRHLAGILRSQMDALAAHGFTIRTDGRVKQGATWTITPPDGDTVGERKSCCSFRLYPYGPQGRREQNRHRQEHR